MTTKPDIVLRVRSQNEVPERTQFGNPRSQISIAAEALRAGEALEVFAPAGIKLSAFQSRVGSSGKPFGLSCRIDRKNNSIWLFRKNGA
jgi:hypothetical protein